MADGLVLGAGDEGLPTVFVKKGSPQRVRPWVREVAKDDAWKDDKAHAALLVQTMQGTQELRRWNPRHIESEDKFAREVMETAQEYTGQAECRVDFELCAFDGDGNKLHRTYALAMAPGDGGEAPNQQGLVRMAMRHADEAHRLLMNERQHTAQAYERTIKFQDKQIVRLQDENAALRKQLEKTQQRMQSWLEKSRQEKLEAELAGARKLDPGALERIGGKLSGGLERVATTTLKEAVSQMSGAEIAALAQEWGPERMAELLGAFQKAKETSDA